MLSSVIFLAVLFFSLGVSVSVVEGQGGCMRHRVAPRDCHQKVYHQALVVGPLSPAPCVEAVTSGSWGRGLTWGQGLCRRALTPAHGHGGRGHCRGAT